MLRKGAILACVGLALLAAGCDPTLERRYVTEGAGVDLFTADRLNQVELLNAYEAFICAQAGASCGSDWATFVQAGMNDIDQRCDGFLTWMDAKRRDREPVLAQISAVNTAVHAIMTVTGSNPTSLSIVTSAFGLASATYANWNSRLLISVDQSTVQEIVYNTQGRYREKIRNYPIPDRPTAIYLLRNYLRLCMPTTIEANINISTTLVQRGPSAAAAIASQGGLVVANVTPRAVRSAVVQNAATPMRPPQQTIAIKDAVRVGFFEERLLPPKVMEFQRVVCLPPDGKFTAPTKAVILKWLRDNKVKDQNFPDQITDRDSNRLAEALEDGPRC